jgi:hypothetical protein
LVPFAPMRDIGEFLHTMTEKFAAWRLDDC